MLRVRFGHKHPSSGYSVSFDDLGVKMCMLEKAHVSNTVISRNMSKKSDDKLETAYELGGIIGQIRGDEKRHGISTAGAHVVCPRNILTGCYTKVFVCNNFAIILRWALS